MQCNAGDWLAKRKAAPFRTALPNKVTIELNLHSTHGSAQGFQASTTFSG